MIKLNLRTSCEEHEIIKNYLQENASDILADKINNGVRIEKDGKTLINKKDLDGFMSYAQNEARKIAEKGKNFKAVYHDVVFGWAVHYFEEDSIEGTLFNEDGTEHKKAPVKTSATTKTKAVETPSTPKDSQFSLFDIISAEKSADSGICAVEEEKQAVNEVVKPEIKETKPKGSFVYQKYTEIQNKYPDYTVAYRLGDFYEVFGENAKKLSEKLDLTLTGRECSIEERVPMIGFPYHASDIYFEKMLKFTPIVVIENESVTVKEQNETTNIDIETGEVVRLNEDDALFNTAKSLDKEIMLKLYDIFGDEMTIA